MAEMGCAVDLHGPPRLCLHFAPNHSNLIQLWFLCWFCGSMHVVTACRQVVPKSSAVLKNWLWSALILWKKVYEYVSVTVCGWAALRPALPVLCLSGYCSPQGCEEGLWVLLLGSWWWRVMEKRLVFELLRAVSLEDLMHHKVLSFTSHHITKVLNSCASENIT